MARGNLAVRTITQVCLLSAENYSDKEKLPLKKCNLCKSAAEQSLKSNADLRDKMFATAATHNIPRIGEQQIWFHWEPRCDALLRGAVIMRVRGRCAILTTAY